MGRLPGSLIACCAAVLLLALSALVLANLSTGMVLARAGAAALAKPGYCNLAGASGAEGRGARALELRGVVIMVRHGDRSAIHTELNGTGASGAGPALSCEARGEIDQLNAAFAALKLSSGMPLRPLGTLRGERGGCAIGQLTPRGIAQHAALGKHLGYAYHRLLNQLANSSVPGAARAAPSAAASGSPFRFRSTNYDRTILSAASLLHAMLPSALLPPSANSKLPIWVQDDEARDELHGVGLASSTATNVLLPFGGEATRAGACAAAAAAALEQMGHWREDQSMLRELARCKPAKLPEGMQRLSTRVADSLFVYSCHDVPLPGCISVYIYTYIHI